MALAIGRPNRVTMGPLKARMSTPNANFNTPQDIQGAGGINNVQKANNTPQLGGNSAKTQPARSDNPGTKNYAGRRLQSASMGGAQGGIGSLLRAKLFGKPSAKQPAKFGR